MKSKQLNVVDMPLMLENSRNSLLKNLGRFQGQGDSWFLYKGKNNRANG